MIGEVLQSIHSFLLILLLSIFAYCHLLIYYTYATTSEELYDSDNLRDTIWLNIRKSYVLVYGELSNWDELDWGHFILFGIFAFFVPLIMTNLIIAFMSDSYSKVQNN